MIEDGPLVVEKKEEGVWWGVDVYISSYTKTGRSIARRTRQRIRNQQSLCLNPCSAGRVLVEEVEGLCWVRMVMLVSMLSDLH